MAGNDILAKGWRRLPHSGTIGEATYKDPKVIIPVDTYMKIHELCYRGGSNEVTWMGTLEFREGHIFLDEIFVPTQQVSYATVDITGLGDLAQQILKSRGQAEGLKVLDKLQFWGHCHPGDSVSPSGTDETTYEALIKDSPTFLMGIFSRDARIAFFRLRYHGLNIRLGWQVVAPDELDDLETKIKTSYYQVGGGASYGETQFRKYGWYEEGIAAAGKEVEKKPAAAIVQHGTGVSGTYRGTTSGVAGKHAGAIIQSREDKAADDAFEKRLRELKSADKQVLVADKNLSPDDAAYYTNCGEG